MTGGMNPSRILLLPLAVLPACASAPAPIPVEPSVSASTSVGHVAKPAEVQANWKERLPQPYVFVEHRGDYRGLGDPMRRLLETAAASDLELTGPPFALFFDDPGRVPVPGLRARACLPVADGNDLPAGVSYDVLPRTMVVYTRVAGAYPEVPRVYPALFHYVRELGWTPGGPVREVYLVNPAGIAHLDELVTEVQVPWAAAR